MADFGKLNFSVSFNPTSAFPLDARSYFDSYESAQAAAQTAVEVGSSDSVYYYGQTLVVVEESVATLYVIQPDKTLKAVGSTSEEGDLADLKQRLTEAEGKLETLNGTGEGSVKKTAEDAATDAINAWAQKVTENDTIDTFKEVVEYVAELGDTETLLADVAQAKADSAQNKTDIGTLQESVGNKVDKEEGKVLSSNDFTTALKEKLESVADNADANVIEIVKAAGAPLDITDKAVDIPMATAEKLGLVKSTDAENGVTVGEDGAMSVNSLNINKLTQTDGEFLIIDGGDSNIQ